MRPILCLFAHEPEDRRTLGRGLHGFMRSERGELRLIALPGGKTRLVGSTFYALEIFPELYWKAWSDGIIHAIHVRVLTHIHLLSEADARGRYSW